MNKIAKFLPTALSIISIALFALIIFLLASSSQSNRAEILKSRQANVEGRAQVLQAIKEACAR